MSIIADWPWLDVFNLVFAACQSRELEMGVYWRDWRALCGLKFLRLEDFLDNRRHGMCLQLEPQGVLFIEVSTITLDSTAFPDNNPPLQCAMHQWLPALLHQLPSSTLCHLGEIHQSSHRAASQTPKAEKNFPQRKRYKVDEHHRETNAFMSRISFPNVYFTFLESVSEELFLSGASFLLPGKNFLRAAQMNMNFATWGRLMMSILPPCSSLEPLSPPLGGSSSAAGWASVRASGAPWIKRIGVLN